MRDSYCEQMHLTSAVSTAKLVPSIRNNPPPPVSSVCIAMSKCSGLKSVDPERSRKLLRYADSSTIAISLYTLMDFVSVALVREPAQLM